MNFLFIFYDRPNYYGGPIVNARRLLPELRRRGHEVHCLILYGGGAAPSVEYLETQGVKCYSRPMIGCTEFHIQWILTQVLKLQPDIFVPNLSVSGWFAARWVRESGIPTVAIMHGDDAFHWGMVEQFVAGPEAWALSGLVCVSEDLRAKVQNRNPKHTQICTIPFGVTVTNANKVGMQRESLKLVYVGRLVQEAKRILDLVDALALVICKYPDIEAALIGSGDQLPEVQKRINHYALNDKIKILGTVPSEDIQSTLANYDILVLLSDHEGTPGAVMDGMAAGLVPICLDIPGGVRELVLHEQTGLLVKDRGNDFLQAVGRLIADDELRRNLSINAGAHIKKHFSLEVAADRWEAFSAMLVAKAGCRSTLVIPGSFSLPPVKPGLAREDKRRNPLLKRMIGAISRSFRRNNSGMYSDFLDPVCIPGKLDTYQVRRSILSSLQTTLTDFEGVLLDVGCGQMPYKSLLTAESGKITRYIGLDLENNPTHRNRPDITWRDGKIPLESDSVDCAISTEVFEHCPDPESVMKEIFRVLKPGGLLFFTVPFLWPLHEVPFDEYRYTPFSLRRHLANSGFIDIELVPLGGWDASLAQMLGLWVRRRPMRHWLRRLMSCVVWPFVCFLSALDNRHLPEIKESSMITGFSGTARKPGIKLQ